MVEKTLKEETLYEGKIMTLKKHHILMENGVESVREIVEHNGAVAVLVVEDQKILFVKQYRKAYEEYVLEIPAGKLEPDENPEACAKRELEEETGLIAGRLDLLQVLYPSPGFCTEKIYLYHARELSEGIISMDDDEFVEPEWIAIDKVREMVTAKQFHDAKTLVAVMLYLAGSTE